VLGLKNAENSEANDLEACAGQLAIAIGSQCCVANESDLEMSRRYFAYGQKRAFIGMLEDPSSDLVCVFLLMSFYLLGACRRNAAFMYIGIAARAAHALGMQVEEQSLHLSGEEQQLRCVIVALYWPSV
jgi:hypothetical protein